MRRNAFHSFIETVSQNACPAAPVHCRLADEADIEFSNVTHHREKRSRNLMSLNLVFIP